jgi:hypothetical protein
MLSLRWRARLGLGSACILGLAAISSLAARSVADRRLLRAAGPPPGGAPAHLAASRGDATVVAQSLPAPSPRR